VVSPAKRLRAKVAASRHIAKFHPSTDTLKKNISGSIEGEAIQNDITGANGTPPISKVVITGITPHEQKGLNAPTAVARKIAAIGCFPNALAMYLDAPEMLITTDSGIVIRRYGQMCRSEAATKFTIFKISCMLSFFRV
jgi:hypothetical protein